MESVLTHCGPPRPRMTGRGAAAAYLENAAVTAPCPPEGELPEFARAARTGRVDVLRSPPRPTGRALPAAGR